MLGAGAREEFDLELALFLFVGQSVAKTLLCEGDLPGAVAGRVDVLNPVVAVVVTFREDFDPRNTGCGGSKNRAVVNGPDLDAGVELSVDSVAGQLEASVIAETECI